MGRTSSALTPDWANILAQQVADNYRQERIPHIQWAQSRKNVFSSGRAYPSPYNRIIVTAGTSGIDAASVLLHELAHWLHPSGEHHGLNFYRTCFKLYKHFQLPTHYCIVREIAYKTTAWWAAKEVYNWDHEQEAYWKVAYANIKQLSGKRWKLPANPTTSELFWYETVGE